MRFSGGKIVIKAMGSKCEGGPLIGLAIHQHPNATAPAKEDVLEPRKTLYDSGDCMAPDAPLP